MVFTAINGKHTHTMPCFGRFLLLQHVNSEKRDDTGEFVTHIGKHIKMGRGGNLRMHGSL